MPGFLYFFEREIGPGKLSKEAVNSLHSIERFNPPIDCLATKCIGPNGKPGFTLFQDTVNVIPELTPSSSHEWLDRGDFWIGWDKMNPPTPDDLQRDAIIKNGYKLEDSNGNSWHLPIVRSYQRSSMLPADYAFGADGSVTSVPKPCYKTYWDLAGELFEYQVSGAKSESWPEARVVLAAVTMLGLNYRVTIHELEAMRTMGHPVLDTNFAINVIMATTDFLNYLAFKKKETTT